MRLACIDREPDVIVSHSGAGQVGSSKTISVMSWPYQFLAAAARSIGGIVAAISARPTVFTAVSLSVFILNVFLPPVFLSLTRKPWDYFAFNPWLSKLPEYLASTDISLQSKLDFLPNLALFWFSANDRIGFVEWGFSVDVSDLLRFVFTAFIAGAYFALWLYHRDQVIQCGWTGENSRRFGIAGGLMSILGLSTGPCSVMGCGAPILPVIGLAFVGLSSGTLKLLAGLSKVFTVVILFAMTFGVAYFGWTVSAHSETASRPSLISSPRGKTKKFRGRWRKDES
jgi:hypothetical protein